MDSGLDLVLLENGAQSLTVSDIGLVELYGFSDDFFNTLQGFLLGVAQVVDNNDIVACLGKLNNGMTADISGTACNKNCHNISSFRLMCYSANFLPIRTPITDAIIRPRVQPLESPRQ